MLAHAHQTSSMRQIAHLNNEACSCITHGRFEAAAALLIPALTVLKQVTSRCQALAIKVPTALPSHSTATSPASSNSRAREMQQTAPQLEIWKGPNAQTAHEQAQVQTQWQTRHLGQQQAPKNVITNPGQQWNELADHQEDFCVSFYTDGRVHTNGSMTEQQPQNHQMDIFDVPLVTCIQRAPQKERCGSNSTNSSSTLSDDAVTEVTVMASSFCIIYNLSLTSHRRALCEKDVAKRFKHARKTLALYHQAQMLLLQHVQANQDQGPPLLPLIALSMNIGHVHRMLGFMEEAHEHYRQGLLFLVSMNYKSLHEDEARVFDRLYMMILCAIQDRCALAAAVA